MKNNITTTREQFFNFIKQEGDTADKALKPTQHYLDYFDKYQATGKKNKLELECFIRLEPLAFLQKNVLIWYYTCSYSKLITNCFIVVF